LVEKSCRHLVQVEETKKILAKQINDDFKSSLGSESSKTFVPTKQLAEACLVVDVLNEEVKVNLLKWLVNRELQEYGMIFGDGEEGAWLDKVDNRYKNIN